MIPQFPQFKALELIDRAEIEHYSKLFPPYSDFNFTSLFTWNTEEKIQISILNNNLVIKFLDYTSDDVFYSFIGDNKVVETAQMLLNHAKEIGIVTDLLLIPEHIIKHEKNIYDHFAVEEDQASFDYVHSVFDLAHLTDRKYYSKLKHLKNFRKLYPGYSVKMLNLREEKEKEDMLELFLRWEKGKNKKKEETYRELKAIKRAINTSKDLGIETIGLYHEGELISFGISEIVHDDHAIFHYAKADPNYKGVYTELYHQVAKYLHQKGVKYLNIEQDLGIEGLRIAKQQWHPVSFLKKYTLSSKK